MKKINVGLLNDSFPPVIDGVANTVINYAKSLKKMGMKAVVATPFYPNAKDDYEFKVVRYPSIHVSENIGYRVGNPFSIRAVSRMQREKPDILHVHSPFTAAVLARAIRMYTKAPIVFTYHTKFNVDIEKRVGLTQVRNFTLKFILNNINAADEVWAVSKGAAENIKELGYTGEVRIMENGTDFSRMRSAEIDTTLLKENLGIDQELVFLFVGRMMWYKNLRFTLDALALAKERGLCFKMIFVGEGHDSGEIREYADALGLSEDTLFVGAIRDRELLRVFFSICDLFLFPSTYDTNGLVVREAAACDCPSLMVRDSCASEGIEHGVTGLLVEETVESYADVLMEYTTDRERLKRIGINAGEKIYVHWDQAVEKAYNRYLEIIERKKKK